MGVHVVRAVIVRAAVWLALLAVAVGVGLITGSLWGWLIGFGAGLVVAGVSTAGLIALAIDQSPDPGMVRQIDGRPRVTDRRAG